MATQTSETEARGPYRKGVLRRAQIIESASELFAELGYAGASIRTIADRVGASPATLFQHFGSKEGLLAAVLEDWDNRTANMGLPSSGHGLDYFRRFPALMEHHLRNPGSLGLFLTMAIEASSPTHPAREFIQNRYASNVNSWTNHLLDAARDGDAHTMSAIEAEGEIRLFIAVLDGLEIQWLLDPSTDLVGLVKTLVDRSIERWRAPDTNRKS